ncbi:hypothetical protein WG66_004072 [Moniliophthora roreri]|nr:hypothetical protein WG66_004072 [Moniliophthora roreri]
MLPTQANLRSLSKHLSPLPLLFKWSLAQWPHEARCRGGTKTQGIVRTVEILVEAQAVRRWDVFVKRHYHTAHRYITRLEITT